MGTRFVGLGKETVFGTPVAATRFSDIIAEAKPDQGFIYQDPVSYRYLRKRNLGQYRTRAMLGEGNANPEGILGDLLLGVFGSESVTNPITNVDRHLFTGAETLPSYTLRLGVEQTQRILSGCLVESLTLKLGPKGPVKYSAELLSGFVETKDTIGTPTLSALKDFCPADAGYSTHVFTIATADKKALVHDFEVTIKNNIPFDRADMSGRGFQTKRYGHREITGKISLYFDSTTEYDRFIAGTEFALNWRVASPEVVVDPQPYYLNVDLRKCVYEKDAAPGVKIQDEPLIIDAPFKCLYDTTDGFNSEGKVTLQNTINAY